MLGMSGVGRPVRGPEGEAGRAVITSGYLWAQRGTTSRGRGAPSPGQIPLGSLWESVKRLAHISQILALLSYEGRTFSLLPTCPNSSCTFALLASPVIRGARANLRAYRKPWALFTKRGTLVGRWLGWDWRRDRGEGVAILSPGLRDFQLHGKLLLRVFY
jgi:hypothetical protein